MKSIFLPAVLLLTATTVLGDIRFSATTERTNVTMGEQIVVKASLVTDKNIGSPEIPQVKPDDSFSLLHTEQRQSQSSSIQIINGTATQKNEITYDFYYVVTPKRNGNFVFPSLEITVNGKSFHTDPITFNVTNEPIKNADIRVSLTLNKQSLYIGEQSILTFKVAQKTQSSTDVKQGFQTALEIIDKSFGKDFSLIRLFTNQVTTSSERINGEIYNTYSLKFILIPLSSGSFNIPSVSFSYAELKRTPRRRVDPFFDDFFDDAFGGGVQAISKKALSNSLPIQVKTLPPAPSDFSGAVGDFSLSATADPLQVAAGDAVTLKVQIKGTSRPGSIGDIKLPSISDCEFFTPERQIQVDTTSSGISTKKIYKYLLIPKQEGSLTIPPLKFTYFDPYSGSYKTTGTDPIQLNILPGKGGSKPQTRYLTQEEIREVGSDIRFIKTGIKLHDDNEKPYREPTFLLLFPIPFLIIVLSILYRFQSSQKERNASIYKRQKALRSAINKLSHLKKRSATFSVSDFLGKVAEIIEQYISNKFGFPATGRTLDELKTELLDKNVDSVSVAELTSFIENLDSYRFGGSPFNESSRAEIIDKTIKFLSNLEKGSKKEKQAVKSALNILPFIIFSFIVLSSITVTSAMPVNSWFENANRFYTEQKFDSAAVYYEKIIQSGFVNSAVYFNLGNADYRLKKIGLARLYYEKASMLAPTDPDIEANIKFLNSNITDKIPEPERGFLESILYQFHNLFSLKTQLWICFWLLFLTAVLFSFCFYITGNKRLWLIYISVLLTLLLVVNLISAGTKIYQSENIKYAIVLSPSLDAKNEPDGHKILFTTHEGTKLRIRKTMDGWSLVSLPNGVGGWVENKDLGKI